jgi:hypothetical protein
LIKWKKDVLTNFYLFLFTNFSIAMSAKMDTEHSRQIHPRWPSAT